MTAKSKIKTRSHLGECSRDDRQGVVDSDRYYVLYILVGARSDYRMGNLQCFISRYFVLSFL